jgi:hypothetical protein
MESGRWEKPQSNQPRERSRDISMKRVSTPLEITGCLLMSILGLYLLYKGTTDQAAAVLISGAVCFPLGLTLLVPAVRSFRWHRQMLRDSRWNQKPNLD